MKDSWLECKNKIANKFLWYCDLEIFILRNMQFDPFYFWKWTMSKNYQNHFLSLKLSLRGFSFFYEPWLNFLFHNNIIIRTFAPD